MKSLIVVASLMLSSSLLAASTPRQLCLDANLEDGYETPAVRSTYSRNIAKMNDQQIKSLPANVKAQLVILAKVNLGPGPGPTEECIDQNSVNNVSQAVECLRQMNESRDEELFYEYQVSLMNGARFNQITFYPGAQVGLVFADGTTTVVAEINDGSVHCVD